MQLTMLACVERKSFADMDCSVAQCLEVVGEWWSLVDRRGLQELSKVRLKEARALLRAGMHDGAYYLAGYAVECGLKACIAKTTLRHEFPDKKRVDSSYSHNFGSSR